MMRGLNAPGPVERVPAVVLSGIVGGRLADDVPEGSAGSS
ncbi:hypothetical protein SHJG_1110 [Streptomyces hygroscopicus subsp. jinggangensis 5008]|nr:hypothetical protein SHJG_1110 [Streptomyces hygroscopicus subsp. jinggangensis 5008]AGF60610.1 hypothetical protein SHJGH_0944 [Streptomyces hygroscopicus subsp. jinggangensis TL01]